MIHISVPELALESFLPRFGIGLIALIKCELSCIVMLCFSIQRHDDTYREFFSGLPQPPNALYSHCYSPMRTKLFIAGGPLPLGLHGNYASVWL